MQRSLPFLLVLKPSLCSLIYSLQKHLQLSFHCSCQICCSADLSRFYWSCWCHPCLMEAWLLLANMFAYAVFFSQPSYVYANTFCLILPQKCVFPFLSYFVRIITGFGWIFLLWHNFQNVEPALKNSTYHWNRIGWLGKIFVDMQKLSG